MRIRTIKPEFFTHEALFELEQETKLPVRLAFIGLWCAADRKGRFKWEPRRLGVSVLPYDDQDFSRVLDALTTRGFVVKYRVNGVWFGEIPSFQRHQVINNREKESDIPESSLADEHDATITRGSRVTDASKAEGKGREGERKGNGKEVAPPDGDRGEHARFIQLWTDAYPPPHGGEKYAFQGGKDGTAVKLLLATSGASPEELMAVAVAAWRHPGGFHCKLAASLSGFNSKFNDIRGELRSLGPPKTGIRENIQPKTVIRI